MTQDEIIEMAKPFLWGGNVVEGWTFSSYEQLETFSKLVEAKEREACAMLCDEMSNTQANMNVAWRNGCRDAATEIRARGEA